MGKVEIYINNLSGNFKEINFASLSNTCKTKGCLIDSSCIIYLDKIFLLSDLVINFNIKTIKQVLIEVLSNNKKMINDTQIINSIQIIKLPETEFSELKERLLTKIPERFKSKLSEVDINLLISSIFFNIPIFTDDGIISKICKNLDFAYYNSLIVPLILLFNDIISEKDAINKLFQLSKIGRYSLEIFDFAISSLEKIVKNNKI